MKTGIIIGGGAVGLAIAGEIADLVDEFYLVEKESRCGEHGSSRSSEVIHSGIYYTPGSNKAQLCVEGNQLLQELCKKYIVSHQMVGKLIVAQEKYDKEKNAEELKMLDFLLERAEHNGVPEVRLIDANEARKMESNVHCIAALHVPTSGVFDSAAYLHTLESIAAGKGVTFVTRTKAVAVEKKHGQFAVTTSIGLEVQEPMYADILINAAGVYADKVAQMINPENVWQIHPVKGEAMYFRKNRKELQTFMHIYPAPVTYTLPDGSHGHTTGVHTAWKPDGRVMVGPLYDEKSTDTENYDITRSARDFLEKIVGFFPNLREEDLHPYQAGIQQKLAGGDFVLQPDKAYENAYHCIGIDSPGLTASLAIAKRVRKYFLGKGI